MSETCPADLPGSAVQTVALAFELADYEVKNGPKQVLMALDSKQVQTAIRDALTEQAKLLLKQQSQHVPIDTSKASAQIAAAVGKAALGAGGEQLKLQMRQSSPYQRLERSVRNLQCAYEKSVIGVWIDENKGLLIIVASGVAIGAAAALYVTNTEFTPADWAIQLAKDKLKTTVLGKLELGVSDIKFVPAKREIGLTAFADASKFKFLKEARLTVNVQATDGKLTHFGGAAQTTIPLGRDFSYSTKLSVDPVARDYALALGLTGKVKGGFSVRILGSAAMQGDKTTLKADGALGYKTKLGGFPTTFSAGLGASRTITQQSDKTECHGQVGLSIDFDFLP
jgi:hypothetical protein